jgi:tripartite-type tricarboxylate transporter receptor subunit TctC
VNEKLRAIGGEPVTGTPEESGALIRSEIERWGRLVREAGIKPG